MSDSATEKGNVAAIGARTRWTQFAVLSAACALVIGVYAWSAHSGLLELVGSGARDSYYNLLVRGYRDGQLNVKREAPPGLAQPGAASEQRINLKPFDDLSWDVDGLHDLSYYKGKLYLYFGATPALVLFWPYVALTGHYLLHKYAVVIFFSAGFLVGAGLVLAAWRRYFAEVSVWMIGSCILALGLVNFAPAILTRSDVYEVAISCGYAFTMLALAGVWRALHDARRSWQWLAAASLACGLAVGARPSLLFGAVILLAPVARAWQEKRPTRRLLLAAGGPIALIGLGILVYNAMRFDNPLEFGQRYQLPISAHQQFSPRFLWFNFRVGFLEPARWSGSFPFVHDISAPPQPAGYFHVDHSFGVLSSIPLVWLALAAPLAWRSRPEEAGAVLRWFIRAVALLFGIGALTLCLHDSMCLRYELEYASPLVLLAVMGILGLERVLANQPGWRRAARSAWGLLLAFSVAFNLLAGFDSQAKLQCGLGSALAQKGRLDEAITQFQEALQMEPDYAAARADLGNALLQKGRVDEAIRQYQAALRIQPNFADARYNLGIALAQKGELDAAIEQYQKALEIKPGYKEAHNNLGTALLQKGRVEEAITQYEKALEINPDDLNVQNNLAWLLATAPDASLRSGAKAVALATRANQSSGGGNPLILHTLAAACAEEGSYGLAATTARRALDLAVAQKNNALAATLQKEIQLYQAGKTVREAPP